MALGFRLAHAFSISLSKIESEKPEVQIESISAPRPLSAFDTAVLPWSQGLDALNALPRRSRSPSPLFGEGTAELRRAHRLCVWLAGQHRTFNNSSPIARIDRGQMLVPAANITSSNSMIAKAGRSILLLFEVVCVIAVIAILAAIVVISSRRVAARLEAYASATTTLLRAAHVALSGAAATSRPEVGFAVAVSSLRRNWS